MCEATVTMHHDPRLPLLLNITNSHRLERMLSNPSSEINIKACKPLLLPEIICLDLVLELSPMLATVQAQHTRCG